MGRFEVNCRGWIFQSSPRPSLTINQIRKSILLIPERRESWARASLEFAEKKSKCQKSYLSFSQRRLWTLRPLLQLPVCESWRGGFTLTRVSASRGNLSPLCGSTVVLVLLYTVCKERAVGVGAAGVSWAWKGRRRELLELSAWGLCLAVGQRLGSFTSSKYLCSAWAWKSPVDHTAAIDLCKPASGHWVLWESWLVSGKVPVVSGRAICLSCWREACNRRATEVLQRFLRSVLSGYFIT